MCAAGGRKHGLVEDMQPRLLKTFDWGGLFSVVSGHFLESVCGERDGTLLFSRSNHVLWSCLSIFFPFLINSIALMGEERVSVSGRVRIASAFMCRDRYTR